MRATIFFALFILLFLVVSNNYAQELTLTTTTANTTASKSIIEMAELNGNPNAIIIATPLGNTATINPHPIGAWYYNGKWNIFNTDHANMAIGAQFKVQYFNQPDTNHFLHIVTKENLKGESSYIDNPALNNNPNALFKIFQNHAPDNRTASLNKFDAKAEYDATAGKWTIKNINGERLFPNTAYNVVIFPNSPKLSVQIPELTIRATASTPSTETPLSVATNVQTDATMVFPTPAPLTVVAREQNFPVQIGGNIALSAGRCYQPVATYTNPNVLITDTVIVNGQAPDNGVSLSWSAAVDNGSVKISVCNTNPSSSGVSGAIFVQGRKMNILVLR
ncbi:MAG TPA: hypothetical protein PKY82_23720 [Pyrinomonadaceae bacterium]|nr:hypothetical protein [Pyrinomonadaceae bacterium]